VKNHTAHQKACATEGGGAGKPGALLSAFYVVSYNLTSSLLAFGFREVPYRHATSRWNTSTVLVHCGIVEIGDTEDLSVGRRGGGREGRGK